MQRLRVTSVKNIKRIFKFFNEINYSEMLEENPYSQENHT